MSVPCEHVGCASPAAFAPRICVPAMGGPKGDPKRAISCFVGLQLCPMHAGMVHPEQWLTPELDAQPRNLRAIVLAITRMKHVAAPDFDRAWFDLVSIDSKEWQDAATAMRGSSL